MARPKKAPPPAPLVPIASMAFKRDLANAAKRDLDVEKLNEVVGMLVEHRPLERRHRDHALKGNWRGNRELHIQGDFLLIYFVDGDGLHLVRTGTHSDLFD